MAYEIPTPLEHKEKIVFGLTLQQLGWATLFGSIILIILTRKGSMSSNIIFAFIPAMLGILFVFFDINNWIKNIISYIRFREAKHMSKNMQKLLEISGIEHGVVHSRRDVAVILITPMNFNIRNTTDQDAIIVGFQKFLNSIDFSIQFVITTNELNLDNYLANMKKFVINKELYEEFKSFMSERILKDQIKTRFFYLIIPKISDLDIQCELCIEKLHSIGLPARRLGDAEISNKLYYFFNDAETVREPSLNDIKNPTHYLIAPNNIVDCIDHLIINQKYCRIISAVGYPRIVESGFLDKIISSNDDFDISIHIEPFAISTMMVMLNRELLKQRADLYSEELKHNVNPSLEIQHNDTRKVLEELQKGNEKLFNVSLYINCKGKNRQELDLLTKKVESDLNAIMIIPSIPIFRQVQAYKSIIPICVDELKIKRNIATHALSAFFPFTSPFLTLEPRGVMLGLNKNKVPYIKDIFSLSNANGLVLATSGAGKSYFTKLLIARQLLSGTKVIVIDPQSEYSGLVKSCNGELVTISKDSSTIINPLDLMGHEFIEKRLSLMDVFRIMFGDLSEVQKSILDRAVAETYAKKGIHSTCNKPPPTLSDLYKVLISMDKKASSLEKITYRALINRLYMYTEGVFNFLDKQTNINFSKDFVCFNIGEMPKQVKPVIMFLILDFVYMQMKSDKQRKLLIIDEAWNLLRQSEDASYIFEIVKTCRKYNMGLLLITQDVADLVNSTAGHAILANSSYSILLRQKPAVIDAVVQMFRLSETEKNYLLTSTQGKGIIILDNEHQELEIIASEKEHEIITTNPNETKRVVKEEINMRLDKKLYPGKNLTIAEKNYLENRGYNPGYFVKIGEIRQEEYYVKTNDIESISHTFLVENIREELLKYHKKVKVSITRDADITFKNIRGETVALEIETGKSYKSDRLKLVKKFLEAKKKYKKNLYIILTDTNYKERYKNQLPGIKVLLRQDIPSILTTQLIRNNTRKKTGPTNGKIKHKTGQNSGHSRRAFRR